MTAGELATAAGAVDPAAPVRVTAMNEPIAVLLNLIEDPQVDTALLDGEGKLVLTVTSGNVEFRIRAPFNTALDEQLIGSNIKNVYHDVENDTVILEIDT